MTRRPVAAPSPSILVAVPSKGRAGRVKTQRVLPSASVFVPALELDAYRRGGARNLVPVPNSVHGITATRNWILLHARSRRLVMIDDDVRMQGYTKLLPHQSRRKTLDEGAWLASSASYSRSRNS